MEQKRFWLSCRGLTIDNIVGLINKTHDDGNPVRISDLQYMFRPRMVTYYFALGYIFCHLCAKDVVVVDVDSDFDQIMQAIVDIFDEGISNFTLMLTDSIKTPYINLDETNIPGYKLLDKGTDEVLDIQYYAFVKQ